MPVYIVEEFHQLHEIIKDLTEDYRNQIKVHVCKLDHRDSNCCESSEMMHDGTHVSLSIVYVAANLERGARVIGEQLMHHFPDDQDHNDEDNILMCPGCGVSFSQQ